MTAGSAPTTTDAGVAGVSPAMEGGGVVEQSVDLIDALCSACARSPDRPEPLMDLARALLDARRAAEAVAPAERAVALAPAFAEIGRAHV